MPVLNYTKMKIKLEITLLLTITLLSGCTNIHELETSYLKEGEIVNEVINTKDILQLGTIRNQYIDTITFGLLDSITYENNNPDKSTRHQTSVNLDFDKPIEKYTPEYYSLYVSHHITKAINYYDTLFKGKLDFNSQKSYKSIEVGFGDVSLFTNPKNYILLENSNPSPSLFYHEVGHRAFWLLEDQLGIEFNGLSIIHMGLLEYFTVSLNNSPLVGEDVFPTKILRDASSAYNYPLDESYKLDYTFNLLKDSYPMEMLNPNSNVARYYNACMIHYGQILNKKVDNHRGGMVLTSTLWRIRKHMGQEKTDQLIAETILNLNAYRSMRSKFYQSEDDLVEKIWWYDLYYGLIDKDQELNKGDNFEIIRKEFKHTGYPLRGFIFLITANRIDYHISGCKSNTLK